MLRSIKRNIARNHMKRLGYDHVNKRMSIRKKDTLPEFTVTKLQKTLHGRRCFTRIRKKNPPLWCLILKDFQKVVEKNENRIINQKKKGRKIRKVSPA